VQYTQLGNSGLTVSRMALGAMTFGHYSFATFHATVDQAGADAMVGLALDAGVNVFDTAEGYGQGQSEEVLGAALKRVGVRDRAVIATKVSAFDAGAQTGYPDRQRMIWSPLAGGFLTGKYTRDDPAGGGARRAEFKVSPIDLERGYPAVDTLREIAARREVPVAHITYAWLFARPEVSSVIVGASRPDQLADNLSAADLSLTDEEVAALDSIDPSAPLYPHPLWLTGGQ
jgi:aryl-alcohol dehydrogenase-like predicted oxidoreductase